jgi:hypothetical protein
VSRKALLKRVPKRVEINGETVMVRPLTLREAGQFDALVKAEKSTDLIRFMVSSVVTDSEGQPLFAVDDPEIDDIPTDVIQQLSDAVAKISNPGKLETAVKN